MNVARLHTALENKLGNFARALVDQDRARVVIPPQRNEAGYWFGGGNLAIDAQGQLYLAGRFRNQGDSRSGLAAGERGLELAIFRSTDGGVSFQKIVSRSKADLPVGDRDVLSIEGSALLWNASGVELFVSSEKTGIAYPPGLESFLKPGCGVWTIDRLSARTVEGLSSATPEPLVNSEDPEHLHVKDPRVYRSLNGDLVLMFCTHPFNWSSSNTAFAIRWPNSIQFAPPHFDLMPRGTTWDVAITRGTCLLDVPRTGSFRHLQVTLLFYDGGESLRNLDEHPAAFRRPRGYSCEELGGLAYAVNGDLRSIRRLSTTLPFFVSPHGTGCSRYVDILSTSDDYLVTWQQSQPDGSQPLVMNKVSKKSVHELLQ